MPFGNSNPESQRDSGSKPRHLGWKTQSLWDCKAAVDASIPSVLSIVFSGLLHRAEARVSMRLTQRQAISAAAALVMSLEKDIFTVRFLVMPAGWRSLRRSYLRRLRVGTLLF